MADSTSTPVLILDGEENALSVTRSLGRRGVTVRVSARPDRHCLRSRYCSGVYAAPQGQSLSEYWEELLLGGGHPELEGSVVFPCSDGAIEFIAPRRDSLSSRYVLGDEVGDQQLALLDKERTIELARAAGIPAPRFWRARGLEDASAIAGEVEYPVIIKPLHSHRFFGRFGVKLLMVRSDAELRESLGRMADTDLEFIVSEWIPGPDSALNSYYTYVDGDGDYLLHFTKRIIRRSPPGSGLGSYHITEWLPETAEMGQRFFRGFGFRGFGNVEFKRDPRDGQLKIIECNARFTGAQEIVVRAGIDMAWIIYLHLTGGRVPEVDGYREFVRLWAPEIDFDAFRDLRRTGQLSFAQWVGSVSHKQCFPFFRVDDPLPAVSRTWNSVRRRVLRSGRNSRERA